jgi:hypothetical protein
LSDAGGKSASAREREKASRERKNERARELSLGSARHVQRTCEAEGGETAEGGRWAKGEYGPQHPREVK